MCYCNPNLRTPRCNSIHCGPIPVDKDTEVVYVTDDVVKLTKLVKAFIDENNELKLKITKLEYELSILKRG